MYTFILYNWKLIFGRMTIIRRLTSDRDSDMCNDVAHVWISICPVIQYRCTHSLVGVVYKPNTPKLLSLCRMIKNWFAWCYTTRNTLQKKHILKRNTHSIYKYTSTMSNHPLWLRHEIIQMIHDESGDKFLPDTLIPIWRGVNGGRIWMRTKEPYSQHATCPETSSFPTHSSPFEEE